MASYLSAKENSEGFGFKSEDKKLRDIISAEKRTIQIATLMSCFPHKSMGLRLKFPSITVSTSSKTDLGFACPIDRVVQKIECPMVVLLQKLKMIILDIRLTSLTMELWSPGLNSSSANFAVVEHNDIRLSSF